MNSSNGATGLVWWVVGMEGPSLKSIKDRTMAHPPRTGLSAALDAVYCKHLNTLNLHVIHNIQPQIQQIVCHEPQYAVSCIYSPVDLLPLLHSYSKWTEPPTCGFSISQIKACCDTARLLSDYGLWRSMSAVRYTALRDRGFVSALFQKLFPHFSISCYFVPLGWII